MTKPLGLGSLLLVTTALIAPSVARAQTTQDTTAITPPPASQDAVPATPAQDGAQAAPDVSVPGGSGGEIVVRGRHTTDVTRTAPQVVSVLSSADIARTGEGNISGALSRVTGLSVVGNGFVYVRGLGDRYSSALLNGSPLPSPEPLKRVIPLDLFPTNIIASSLVQKSYSVNFPGEFGGGVINLTTKTAPTKPFLTVGGAIGGDSFTTGQLGYTYFGSASDWTGFDNGQRHVPPALRAFFNSGNQISDPAVDQQAIARQLIDGRNSVVQRNKAIPPNAQASLTGGTSIYLGGAKLGLIATAGYSNSWRTRDVTQQTANAIDLSSIDRNYERVVTENHVVANGLLGLSLEFGDNKVRATGLYIHDTLKQARLSVGEQEASTPGITFMDQDTAWFERQLIDTQLVGEFKLAAGLSVDLRGGYANSKRNAPDEIGFTYARTNDANDPYGAYFIDTLNVGRTGSATIAFSKLNEDLWSGGADVSYKVFPSVTATVGYAYSDTNRTTDRRSFLFQGNNDIPLGVSMFRPDLLLEPVLVQFYHIGLVDNEGGNPAFRAKLRVHAGYGQIQAEILPGLSLNAGVRYEKGTQTIAPVAVYSTLPSLPPATDLRRSYWLPAATLTLQLNPAMQVRVSASKTIARPQFRELVFQTYYDPESNNTFRGNPQLIDSQLYNAEARYEWYFAKDQRIAVAGFFKRIDHPIETYASFDGNDVFTSFANAPKANLYGGEIETQKYFDLSGISSGGFFTARRAVVVANYTYTKSQVKVGPNDPVAAFPLSVTLANQLFRDGSPLTGQSNHLANLEFGLEERDHVSQQTFLLSYATKRVTRRGPSGQPDILEKPGLHLDFVARQGVRIAGINTEMKFELRNITGTRYQEYQQSGKNVVYYNLYDVGRSATFGWSVNF